MVFAGCFAGMAPKTSTNTGKRPRKEIPTPQTSSRNQSYNHQRFKSRYHHDRYNQLHKLSLWKERVFQINPEGPYKHILQLFLNQGWDRLLNPITDINTELVQEFYANALPKNPKTDEFPYETFVRGKTIRFDREAINKYLGNPFPLDDQGVLDDFHDKQNRGVFLLDKNHATIKKYIMLEGESYEKSDAGRENIALNKLMKKPARLVLRFILHNVRPKSHLADCTVNVCPLIYYILKGKKVDIARTIAWELRLVALQGHGEPKTRLSFPGLIMGLIKDTEMNMPTAVHDIISNPINDDFITRHIWNDTKKDKGKGKKASSSRAPTSEPNEGPIPFPPAAGFDFSSYVQWQHENNVLNFNMMSAIHKENMYLQQSQYLMQQQSSYPPEIMAQFMTPTAFQEYANWPEDTPKPFGGAEFHAGGNGADENMAEDEGDGNEEEMLVEDDGEGSEEGNDDQNDPANVPSATSDGSDDDMEG